MKARSIKYTLFHDGKYYMVPDPEGILKRMREDAEFRRTTIEKLKEDWYVTKQIDKLVKLGYLEVQGHPPKQDYDQMAIRFIKLIKKEFPKEWRETKIHRS